MSIEKYNESHEELLSLKIRTTALEDFQSSVSKVEAMVPNFPKSIDSELPQFALKLLPDFKKFIDSINFCKTLPKLFEYCLLLHNTFKDIVTIYIPSLKNALSKEREQSSKSIKHLENSIMIRQDQFGKEQNLKLLYVVENHEVIFRLLNDCDEL